jgi:hypothetical protein
MIRKQIMTLSVLAGLAGLSPTIQADDALGWIEKIRVQPWGVEAKAKLDTGALTSSMHAEDIEHFKRDDEDWVRFTIDLENTAGGEDVRQRIERPLLREFTVRGAGGRAKRSVVLMKVCIGDTIYEEQFGLRDRSNMLYPILLGRRTIQHLGPVDVSRTFQVESSCNADSPVLTYNEVETDKDIGVN